MEYLIGIDVGTTGTKTLIIDKNGKVLASQTEEYPLIVPRPNWAEQNPQNWFHATITSIKKALRKAKVKKENIKGIGLTGQMHGSVFLDKNHNVIRPAILWCDQRTAKESQDITNKIGYENLIKYTSNPVFPGFTLPKIIWVRNNEPHTYEKIFKVLLPKDYVRFRLTGEFATDVSDASGTSILNVKERKWSDEMLKELDIPKSFLPDCYESEVIVGKITKKIAQITELPENIPCVAGAGDQAAQAIGTGILKEGILSATIGTSGVVFASCDELKVDNLGRVHSFCHAVKNKWHVMGVMLAAGGSLRWFRDNVWKVSYNFMTGGAKKVKPGSDGLLFLPYLTGERTPHGDPDAKGVFFGLSLKHTKFHLIRSILEGVTFGMRDSLEIIKSMGIKIKEVRVSGGGAKSALWRQIQADVYKTPVMTVNVSEGAAYGAAILAAVGSGVYPSVEDACRKVIKITSVNEPIKENVEVYEKCYARFRSLYPVLKNEFKKINQ